MAVNQPLKGISKNGNITKLYSVINNFNKGIDKKTADDVAVDSSFKELKNFYNSNEGILSKRPAVYDSNFNVFIKTLIDDEYNPVKFNIVTNRFNETKSDCLDKLRDFYDTIMDCKTKEYTHSSNSRTIAFTVDKIIGFQILKNNKFLEALQDYETIFDGSYSSIAASSLIEFRCIIVGGGFSTDNGTNKTTGLYITRFDIRMEYETGVGYTVNIEIDSVDPTISNSPNRRWLYTPENYDDIYIQSEDEYKPLGPIDIANYNGFSYIPTGKNYFIRIDQNPESKTTHSTYTNEASLFSIIGGDSNENLYKPTAIELTQIGFNILHSDPVSYYENTGQVAKIKGLF